MHICYCDCSIQVHTRRVGGAFGGKISKCVRHASAGALAATTLKRYVHLEDMAAYLFNISSY